VIRVGGEVQVISGSQRSAARVAALAFPISFAFLVYANFGVREPLLVGADSAEIVRRIAATEPLFRLSVAFDLVYCTGFLVLLTALYVVLSPVNRYVALLASVSKLVYAVTAALMAFSFLTALHLASDPAYVQSLGPGTLQAMIQLNSAVTWDQYYVGLVFWALSSTLFGWLWLKSRYVPAALALFGLVTSVWCLFCTVAYVVKPAFANVVNVWFFDTPMALFYIVLSGWLLFRGLRGAETPVA
jgi:hypothetical protein